MTRRPGARRSSPSSLPVVHLARDHHRSVVARLVRDGTWVRVRPGAYVDASALPPTGRDRVLALARIVALGTQLTSDAVVSHTSAALLWGLPILRAPATTHIVQPYSARSGAGPGVVRHRLELAPEDVATVRGIPVTSLERTVVDCATWEPVRGGVVIADAALGCGADRASCVVRLTAMAGRRGVVRARMVLDLADDGAESAGESLARVALLAVGAPRPQTQVAVRTELGTYWSDLGWPAHRVLAEYDGRSKYAGLPAEAVMLEKRREDALLDAGWRLLRLAKEDLAPGPALAARVRRALPGVPLTPRPALAR